MNKVVERGLARCQRCATTADYVFIECDSNVTRYEVHCRSCGEVYSENSLSWTLAAARDEEPFISWPPDCDPVAPRDWRSEVRAWMADSTRQGRKAVEVVGLRAEALGRRVRAELGERLRNVRDGQTGG